MDKCVREDWAGISGNLKMATAERLLQKHVEQKGQNAGKKTKISTVTTPTTTAKGARER